MSTIEQLPPHNREAEEAVLGSLLIDPDAIFEVAGFLKPEAFHNQSNRDVFEAILRLYGRRDAVDTLTVLEELRRHDKLEQVGGEAYVVGLVSTVPTSLNAASYGRIVEAAAVRRQLLQAAGDIAKLAYDEEEDIDVVIDRAEQRLFGVSEKRTTRDLTPIRDIAQEYLQRIEELNDQQQDVVGVPTGFMDMDKLLGGLNRSDLLILAARPGMGKCVTADTLVLDPRTGERVPIETLIQRQEAVLLTLNERYQLQEGTASHFVNSGVKPVYKVRTALGREIKTTHAHPFLTIEGWRPLYQLAVGERVAVPRRLPVMGNNDVPEHEAKVLAYLLADGCVTGTTAQFSNTNPVLRDDFTVAALGFPGNKARVQDSGGKRVPTVCISQDEGYESAERPAFAGRLRHVLQDRRITMRWVADQMGVAYGTVRQWVEGRNFPSAENFAHLCAVLGLAPHALMPYGHAEASQTRSTLTQWLMDLGVWGKGAAEKFVPAVVFTYTRPRLVLFLNRLFACDGAIYVQNGSQPAISYSTISRQLAYDVAHLLLRVGIVAKVRQRTVRYAGQTRPTYELRITEKASVSQFVTEIGALGKETAVAAVQTICAQTGTNPNRDTIPLPVWEAVREVKGERSWSAVTAEMGLGAHYNLHVGRRAPSRERLAALADVLGDEPLRDLAHSDVYWDEIVAIEPLGEQQVYDLSVPITHNFVADDMIVHNTSLQNAIALTAARTYKKRVAIFNLEMSGEQLVQRMLAAETRIDLQRLRRGQLTDPEWSILYEAIERLSETRIFIDDSPIVTPMQLRTKCRRLYAEHGIDLIMIDYLQLMQSDRSSGGSNRVQEIGDISRGLKQLARELDVPVLAAAQLSRAVESRNDKRPVLSDLRDSGCLTGDTLVTLAESGCRVPMAELVGQAGFAVWALNETTWKLEKAMVSRAFSTGVKPVYRLRTQLGRTIRATGNHQFRTIEGWKRLDELTAADFLALPRQIPADSSPTMSKAELALLGHLIGDGCVLPRHSIQYTTKELELAELVSDLAQELFGDDIAPRINPEKSWYQVYLTSTRHHTHGVKNAISDWFNDLGIFGLRSHEKRVPPKVFNQPASSIALFLCHLWATDGCIHVRFKSHKSFPTIYYATSSEQLAQDVQSLLLRLGINARIRMVSQKEKGRDQYHVIISGKPDMMQFVERIGAIGQSRLARLEAVRQHLEPLTSNTNRDVLPNVIWRQMVVPAMQVQGMTSRQMQAAINQPYCGTGLYKQNVSRERAWRVATAVQSPSLAALAQSDVYWDKIVAIEPDGEEEVFDLTVPHLHNFVADDIIVHNSIEQDADIVMFIYRDEYYNPDSTDRPGIAEINIAKHRNGPTATIDLYWNAELASFANLQRQEVRL